MTRHDTPLTGLRNKDRDTTVSSTPKGMNFVRAAIALAIAEKDQKIAQDIAAKRWGDRSVSARMLETKADVPAGSVITGGWGSQFVSDESGSKAAAEFYGEVNRRSILGRLPGLRMVPARTPFIRSLSTAATAWYSEGEGRGLSSVSYTRTDGLQPCTLATMIVITDELLRDSSPEAEMVIREEMIRGQAVALDDAFINPANEGFIDDFGVMQKPESITSSTTEATAGDSPEGTETGTVPEQAADALEAMLDSFSGELENSVIIMEPKMATRICNTNRPNVGATGGMWAGIPVLTSSNVPGGVMVLVDPAGLAVCLPQQGAEIRVSTHGNVDMVDKGSLQRSGDADPIVSGSPEIIPGPVGTTTVSLFQTNAVALLAQRVANWRVVRPGSVAWVSGLSY
jgi:hypothetical protein